ncbi:MAG: flagellar type III secretion system protein FlhB [Planktotalea sp.]|jgi:flagellar biosynthetic protein FlhB|uniref:EscU/YscU/HrcU family type III secretion system export apparatus switch protein n=1 Tax=Planktotalea sp. TaxID=2029877 RepID=UPI002619D849|nr:flagellar type III secretion system protein FlhB [Planktotalea sp.]MDG1085538.1 flagellar type III secretion system protein FlhB [Planktotalea sp.]
MAEGGSDGQEKTEEPTQKRLDKAKEDGQVPSSKELFVFTTLFIGMLIYVGLVPVLPSLVQEWGMLFSFSGEKGLTDAIFGNLGASFRFMFWKSVVFALPMLVVVIATQAAMSGLINWSNGALAFKASRINPLSGLKRMVSMKALVEMLKAIGKVTLLISASVMVFVSQIESLLVSNATHLTGGLSRMNDVFVLLIIVFLFVLGIMAMADVMYQHYQHNKQLKMTLQEVRDESKQTEGSPEVKAKIRRMQMTAGSRAKERKAAMDAVPTATAIITNPTHFAVALKYEVGTVGAPTILAMGRGHFAQEIISTGRDAGVTIFRNELLARALFFAGQVGEEIPAPLFSAVAGVLAFIYRLNEEEEVDAPEVELPEDMRFDENGKALL